jgi:hypothetical protein
MTSLRSWSKDPQPNLQALERQIDQELSDALRPNIGPKVRVCSALGPTTGCYFVLPDHRSG